MLVLVEGTLVTGGDKDRMVRAWDTNRDFAKVGTDKDQGIYLII